MAYSITQFENNLVNSLVALDNNFTTFGALVPIPCSISGTNTLTLTQNAVGLVPTPAGLRLQHAEIREPHFARAFSVSPDFDTSKIDANLQDGVLKLTIPRRDEARPRRIEVQTN